MCQGSLKVPIPLASDHIEAFVCNQFFFYSKMVNIVQY